MTYADEAVVKNMLRIFLLTAFELTERGIAQEIQQNI